MLAIGVQTDDRNNPTSRPRISSPVPALPFTEHQKPHGIPRPLIPPPGPPSHPVCPHLLPPPHASSRTARLPTEVTPPSRQPALSPSRASPTRASSRPNQILPLPELFISTHGSYSSHLKRLLTVFFQPLLYFLCYFFLKQSSSKGCQYWLPLLILSRTHSRHPLLLVLSYQSHP